MAKDVREPRVHDDLRRTCRRGLYAGERRGSRLCSRPRRSRQTSLHPRDPRNDVSRQALDDAPIQRIRNRRGNEPALSVSPGARTDRAVGGLSPPDLDGLRLGSSDVRGRSRQVRRRDRFPGRHGSALRRHPARQDQHVDDDECPGDDSLVHVSGGRGKAGSIRGTSSAGRSRTTSSRNTSPRRPTSFRRGLR